MKWKYKITIKEYFEDETTPELIVSLCARLNLQLNKILKSIDNSNIVEEEKSYLYGDLEMVIDNFDFLNNLANGAIPQKEWENYSFDGDFQKDFNEYLTQLFDLGDMRVNTTAGIEKFIWVG